MKKCIEIIAKLLLAFALMPLFIACGGDDAGPSKGTDPVNPGGNGGGNQPTVTVITGSWYLHITNSKGEVYIFLTFNQDGTGRYQELSNESGVYQWTTDGTFQHSFKDNVLTITTEGGHVERIEVMTYTAEYLFLKNWPDNGTNTFAAMTPAIQSQIEELMKSSFANVNCPDNNHPHMVDLGLPSGTLWACCHVGANYPEEYGSVFSWGRIDALPVGTIDDIMNYPFTTWPESTLGNDIARTEYDMAYVNWGSSWNLPSRTQCEELAYLTTSEWVTQNGVKGQLFTGANGNKIFMPAVSGVYNGTPLETGEGGACWSSHNSGGNYSAGISFMPERGAWIFIDYVQRCHSVRPVKNGPKGPSTEMILADMMNLPMGDTQYFSQGLYLDNSFSDVVKALANSYKIIDWGTGFLLLASENPSCQNLTYMGLPFESMYGANYESGNNTDGYFKKQYSYYFRVNKANLLDPMPVFDLLTKQFWDNTMTIEKTYSPIAATGSYRKDDIEYVVNLYDEDTAWSFSIGVNYY